MSENQVKEIAARFLPDINTKRWYYPKVICARCSFSLTDSVVRLEVHVYQREPRVSTRSGIVCDCDVCVVARVNLTSLGGVEKKKAKKRGRPAKLEVPKRPRTAKYCTVCFSEIAQGKTHKCTSTARHHNVLQFVRGDQPGSGDSVVAAYLRESRSNENGTVTLSNSRGRPSTWTAGSSGSTPRKLSVDDLFLLKRTCDLSTRKTLLLSKALRGMDIELPSKLSQELTRMNQRLKEFFSVTRLTFDNGPDKDGSHQDETLPVVYCNNVKGLIEYTQKERKEPNDVFYKLGADGGGGSFKITLSIVEKAPSTVKGFKDTGVKKLFVIALAPKVSERYNNILLLWSNLLRLDELDSVIASDLKVVNILLGIMGHSSSHPCPYCNVSKLKLSEECGDPRTLGSIGEYFEQWVIDGSDEKRAKDFFNCVKKPMLCGAPEVETVMICPPPNLHIILGVVNAIYKAVEAADTAVASEWARISCCQRHSKYGFTGRNCHKLLEKKFVLSTDGPVASYRSVLDNFAKVFKACLQESLAEDFREIVEAFANSWIEAGLPNSSKFHILRYHVPQFCEAFGTGLGRYGEQASETVHFDFNLTWQKLKVPETSPLYDDRLLQAVVLYNSSHLN